MLKPEFLPVTFEFGKEKKLDITLLDGDSIAFQFYYLDAVKNEWRLSESFIFNKAQCQGLSDHLSKSLRNMKKLLGEITENPKKRRRKENKKSDEPATLVSLLGGLKENEL